MIIIILIFLSLLNGCGKSEKVEQIPVSNVPSKLYAVSFHSKALDKAMKLNIYLPPGYDKKFQYPVLYMLPGSSGEQNFCMPKLKIQDYATSMIKKHQIAPIIIVTMEMDNSFGLNSSAVHKTIRIKHKVVQLGRYSDYITSDLVQYIDSHYSTIRKRKGRFIGGISDGGYVALRTAFLHPQLYSKVGGHSPNLSHENPNPRIEHIYFPKNESTGNKNIYYVAANYDLSGIRIYLDCGSEDTHHFYIGCNVLSKILKKRDYDVQYHQNAGKHGFDYWESQIPAYLKFYASN